MKSRIIEAAIIAVGITLLGYMIRSGIENFKERDRVVSVKGLAELEVAADKVVWPLMYKELGNDLLTLYHNIQTKNRTIVAFLQANGIKDEEITVTPAEIIDMEAERYSSQTHPYRYNATSVITVSSTDVEKVRKLIAEQTELLKQGVAITGGDYRYSILYEFTGLNSIKPEMIEEATNNARRAAEKFATDSGSKLGKIRDASQGQFTITDRDANTPFIKNVRVVTTINYYLRK
ncbi:MAG: SIMPL domain-containing protein [bacterium]|nr:SIMPL domain-containing protein [bacterium]MDD3968155.1 SIMPL domain-containing protein [Proteiniphilum sp.]MDD4458797.1 SIMPL domain-containing protein [Proteiniphilum sp.]